MTVTDEEVFVFEKEEFEIPCDAADREDWPDTPGPAKWAMTLRCPGCGFGGVVLLCNDCKDFALNYKGSTYCNNTCPWTGFGMTEWITSINPI